MSSAGSSSNASVAPPAPGLRVLVLVQRPESWANVEDVVACLRGQPGLHVDVLALPYDHSQADRRTESAQSLHALLVKQGVPATCWFPGMPPPSRGAYQVAVFTAPYDRERPPSFHFREVARRVHRTVYIPYGLAVGAGTRNLRFQFGQPTQRHADLVVARSGLEKALYERYCPTGSRHVVVLGSPRLDRLANLGEFPVDANLVRQVGGRTAILWNSHFSFPIKYSDGMEYSTFDRMAGDILRFAASTPSIALVWRPHPRLFREILEAGLLTSGQVEAMRKELAAAGVIIDDRPDHRHAFAVASALMTDLGSFLVEFLATGRPMLYLENLAGEGPNEEGLRIIQGCETAANGAQAIEFMTRVMNGVDASAVPRENARRIVLPHLGEGAARRVAEAIQGIGSGVAVTPGLGPATDLLLSRLDGIAEAKRRREPWVRRIRRWVGDIRARLAQAIKESRLLMRWMGGRG